MHVEKKYRMDTTEGRDEAAKDFESFIGARRAQLVKEEIASGGIESLAKLRLISAMFLGVEGAPVTAFGERHGLYD